MYSGKSDHDVLQEESQLWDQHKQALVEGVHRSHKPVGDGEWIEDGFKK